MKIEVIEPTEVQVLCWKGDTRTVTLPKGWYRVAGSQDPDWRIELNLAPYGRISVKVPFEAARPV